MTVGCTGGDSNVRGGVLYQDRDLDGRRLAFRNVTTLVEARRAIVEGGVGWLRFSDLEDVVVEDVDTRALGAVTANALGQLWFDASASTIVTVRRLRGYNNTIGALASSNGSGLARGGLLFADSIGTLDLDFVDARGNLTVADGTVEGGVVYTNDVDVLGIESSIFAGNQAGTPTTANTRGAAVFYRTPSSGGNFLMGFADLVGNEAWASNEVLGALTVLGRLGGDPTPSFVTGTTVAFNTASGGTVEGADVSMTNALPTWVYNNIFNTAGSPSISGFVNPTGTAGNRFVDPQYVDRSGTDPRTWDLRLSVTSPLVDAGDPFVADADGTRSDIGAYGGPFGDQW